MKTRLHLKILMLFLVLMHMTLLAVGQTADITLKVTDIEEAKGLMAIAIYNSSEAYAGSEEVFIAKSIDVDSIGFTIVFTDIPHGSYAIAVFHDMDGNHKHNTNWIGIPKEPFGFSNNAKGKMGPPDFEDVVFELTGDMVLNIKLIHLL